MSKLVIVESPSKAKTIQKYLGSGYKVMASKGHVRDLPKSRFGIDVAHGFKPQYVALADKKELIASLKKEASESEKVYLATDPDREGEAISWHLATLLGLDLSAQNRVAFNEITKNGVVRGMEHPTSVNMDLVDAQQARRVLDRIVGYKISPLLWKKVRKGLSAGRVQSVALRLIVDRENEIRAFVPDEFWSVDAKLVKDRHAFDSKLVATADGRKLELHGKEECDRVLAGIESKPFVVSSVKKGTKTRTPAPPFNTSSLQQEASRKLNFSAKHTMSVAQKLYEGVTIPGEGLTGLITYMRTDSLRISEEARAAGNDFIKQNFGEKYLPDKPRYYKAKAGAQDAHEAIRPTHIFLTPSDVRDSLTPEQYKLYKLIWERFIASLMSACVMDTVTADITCGDYLFRSNGFSVKFDGYTKLYVEGRDEEDEQTSALPPLCVGDTPKLRELAANQHFTQPPQRYTEATLIKALEENGIGRPATYAPILSNILTREYIEKDKKSIKPTPLGETITGVLCEHFKNIVNVKFTAGMESSLDRIEAGETDWVSTIESFYSDFDKSLKAAEQALDGKFVKVPDIETDVICDKCGRKMVEKTGRYGKFLACPGYPECRNTMPIEALKAKTAETGAAETPATDGVETDVICEKCGRKMIEKKGKFGKFLACPGYPECKNTKTITKETGGECPICGGKLLEKRSKRNRIFYGCENNPKCGFMTWDEPVADRCPTCGKTLFVKGKQKICHNEACADGKPTASKKESKK